MRIQFVVSAYGDKYSGMLLTSVFSIISSQKKPYTIRVYWQDISDAIMQPFRQAYSEHCEFTQTAFVLSEDPDSRISMKTLLWEKAVKEAEDSPLVLLDGDTLVNGDISHFFDEHFDIGFTVKDERVPINSGVLLVKTPKRCRLFFQQWREHTIAILQSKVSYDEAIRAYGGIDQKAFADITGFQRGKEFYEIFDSESPLIAVALPCIVLNETRSVPVSAATLIYHFKGGWRFILTEGKPFTKNRSKKESFAMYLLYMKTFLKAAERLVLLDKKFDVRMLGVVVPFYAGQDGYAAHGGYALYLIAYRFKRLLLKIRRWLAYK